MGKLMKYDLKGGYKKFSILFIITIILNIVILFKMNEDNLPLNSMLVLLVCFASALIVLIFCAGDFEKELYEERAYLTFTLPVKGRQIIASKVLVYLIWALVNSIIIAVFFMLCMKKATGIMGISNMSFSDKIYWPVVLINIVSAIFSMASFILLLHLCTILPRVANLNVKLGKFMSGVIFIAILVGIGYLGTKIGKVFPKSIYISSKGITDHMVIESSNIVNNIAGLNEIFMPLKVATINIASSIYDIVLFVIFFVSSSYLLEKKIDLK
ncbi:hypothetical protein [Haloimpatiens lingqiaonensis]|uniref:hypothetical protein n=1 Tax=Haloimpatiens lingqiaonensis TaxID=1380675 RepID=UPI0010FDF83B|nr:hypothetical protein [Haloimpatiens lingqiaonensis]